MGVEGSLMSSSSRSGARRIGTTPLTFDIAFENIELMGMEALNVERLTLNDDAIYDLSPRIRT